MGKNGDNSKGKEHIVNFALLIKQVVDHDGIKYHVESQNQGVPDSEVILIVESWLEQVKNKYKSKFKF